jgi:hypothetical protein
MIKIRTRSIRIPKIGDKFCILETTDVLTSQGWIQLKNITLNHEIATLVDDHKLEYVKPIDIYKFNYKGPMYKVRSKNVDLDVTIDHELYVKLENSNKYELIKANELIGKRYRFKKNCDIYDGKKLNYSEFNNYIKENTVVSIVGDKNIKDCDFFDDTLNYYIDNFNMTQSNEVLEQSSFKTKKEYRSTCDKLMTLAIHSGKSINIIDSDINDYSFIELCNDNEPYVENEELYNYDGVVGCLEVPSHVFMIRQNGKNVWIGNCSRHGHH